MSTCAEQARGATDLAHDIDRLADFLEESISLPKKMSYMAGLVVSNSFSMLLTFHNQGLV